MKVKVISGTALLLLGAIGLIIGMFGIFGDSMTKFNPWIFAILGLLFFVSGITLMRSVNN